MTKTMPDGKRKSFYGHSDAEVEQKYRDALEAFTEGGTPVVRKFKDVADDWWEKKEPQLSPNSRNNFRCAKRRAIEAFGDLPVTDVTPHMIISMLQKFSLQGYSQKVISGTKSVIKTIFDSAIIAGEIDRNPCADLPTIAGRGRTPRQSAEDEDIRLIEQHKNDSNISRMYYFMLYTGLRRGEATALQYKHINREKKTVKVEQSCAWDNNKPFLKLPKTAAGIRTVALLDNVADVIGDGDPEEYIFFGELPNRKTIEHGFEKFRAETGIKATPHQLRHSYASLLHSAGVDVKDAQSLLGHSTVAMTQDIYTHLEQMHKEKVYAGLNDYVSERMLSK